MSYFEDPQVGGVQDWLTLFGKAVEKLLIFVKLGKTINNVKLYFII